VLGYQLQGAASTHDGDPILSLLSALSIRFTRGVSWML